LSELRQRGLDGVDARGIGMSRIRRFEEHRFLGDRRTMTVYDCDDPDQGAELELRVGEDQLLGRNMIQAFAPDELAEARNRSFNPARILPANS
jgi:hypothetical protein